MGRKPELRIFFFGDSISFGQGVSPSKAWVTRLAHELEMRFGSQAEIVVQNPSINGNTTRLALERMPYDVQSHRPHLLNIQFGMNDCNVWQTDNGHPRVSPEAFIANLSEIIDRGRRCGSVELLLATNHPSTRTALKLPNVEHTYEDSNRRYNQLIRDVAARTKVTLVDIEKYLDSVIASGQASTSDLVLDDGLHLSEKGHNRYFLAYIDLIAEATQRIMKRQLSRSIGGTTQAA